MVRGGTGLEETRLAERQVQRSRTCRRGAVKEGAVGERGGERSSEGCGRCPSEALSPSCHRRRGAAKGRARRVACVRRDEGRRWSEYDKVD